MFRTIKNYNDSVKKQLLFRNKNLKTDIKKHAQSNVFFYIIESAALISRLTTCVFATQRTNQYIRMQKHKFEICFAKPISLSLRLSLG